MNSEINDELSSEERRAFADLPREKAPPSLLEDRVVQSLRDSSLIRPARKFSKLNATGIGLAIAASLLFFVLGALVTRWLLPSAPQTASPDFILVLRQGREQQTSREDELRIAREYGSWARQLSGQGVLSDGEKLMDESLIVTVVNGRPVALKIDANQVEASMAGYFLIKAQSYEQALKIAETCPHLKYGGTIEVRQIDRL